MQVMMGLVQRKDKGATNDFFLLNSYFDSSMSSKAVKDIRSELIGLMKTNTKYFKDTINNLMKYCT